jgi:hypothetical protein
MENSERLSLPHKGKMENSERPFSSHKKKWKIVPQPSNSPSLPLLGKWGLHQKSLTPVASDKNVLAPKPVLPSK